MLRTLNSNLLRTIVLNEIKRILGNGIYIGYYKRVIFRTPCGFDYVNKELDLAYINRFIAYLRSYANAENIFIIGIGFLCEINTNYLINHKTNKRHNED